MADMPTANARISQVAKYTRIILYWNDVAPTKPADPTNPSDPAYQWSSGRADLRINGALDAGLIPLVTVWRAPRWAEDRSQFGGEAGTVNPNAKAFGEFAQALAKKYPRVHMWEAWNEPNLDHFLTPQIVGGKPYSPDMYRELLNAFYDGIHAVDPNAQVAGGALARRYKIPPLAFIRDVFCLGSDLQAYASCPTKVDVWSHHPYTNGGPFAKQGTPDGVSLGDLPKMRTTLKAAALSGNALPAKASIPLWVSEFSWDTDGPDPDAVPMALHARWISEALYQAWRSGVTFFVWHQLRDRAFPSTQYQSGFYFCGARSTSDDVNSRCDQSGFYGHDQVKSASLLSFRFPFVAYASNGRVKIWGRTADSEPHQVAIERKVNGKWRSVRTVTADEYGIFGATWRSSDRRHTYRALVPGGARSNGFSLKKPRGISLPNTWGCGGTITCRSS